MENLKYLTTMPQSSQLFVQEKSRVIDINKNIEKFDIKGGVIEMQNNKIIVLAE